MVKSLEKRINGCYTKLLRMVLNVSWKDKWSNKKLYNDMPNITNIIATRRLIIAGHCIRHKEEAKGHNLIFWEPKGKRKQERCAVTFVDNLKEDTDLEEIDEIGNVMMMRDVWKKIAKSGRT